MKNCRQSGGGCQRARDTLSEPSAHRGIQEQMNISSPTTNAVFPVAAEGKIGWQFDNTYARLPHVLFTPA